MDRDFGVAAIHKISRHSHPMVIAHSPETIKPTGIGYLSLVDKQHRKYLGSPIGYRELNTEEEK